MNRFHFLAVALVLGCYGCNSSDVSLGIVNGKVTIDGKPLANAIVTFVPKQGGRAALGTTDPDGNYQLIYSTRKGALVGTHDVTIQVNPEGVGASTESQEAPSIYDKQGAGAPEAADAKARSDSRKQQKEAEKLIPEKYRKPGELTAEVKTGSNEINFELKST